MVAIGPSRLLGSQSTISTSSKFATRECEPEIGGDTSIPRKSQAHSHWVNFRRFTEVFWRRMQWKYESDGALRVHLSHCSSSSCSMPRSRVKPSGLDSHADLRFRCSTSSGWITTDLRQGAIIIRRSSWGAMTESMVVVSDGSVITVMGSAVIPVMSNPDVHVMSRCARRRHLSRSLKMDGID